MNLLSNRESDRVKMIKLDSKEMYLETNLQRPNEIPFATIGNILAYIIYEDNLENTLRKLVIALRVSVSAFILFF